MIPVPASSAPARLVRVELPPAALALPLRACSGSYSPDTYATRAVQQANKVEQGVIAGGAR